MCESRGPSPRRSDGARSVVEPGVALGLGRCRGDRHPLPERRRLGLAGEAVHRGAGMGAAGSQLMTSNRPSPHASSSSPPSRTRPTPVSPGPPGLMKMVPIRSSGRLAGVADHRQLDLLARGVGPVQRARAPGARRAVHRSSSSRSRLWCPGGRGRPGARRTPPIRPGAACARGQRQRRQGGDRRPPPAASVRSAGRRCGAPHALKAFTGAERCSVPSSPPRRGPGGQVGRASAVHGPGQRGGRLGRVAAVPAGAQRHLEVPPPVRGPAGRWRWWRAGGCAPR